MSAYVVTSENIVESFPVLKAFLIECRTGCSCCSSENHHRGPFRTREEAEKAVQRFREVRLIASQYAPNGVYNIEEIAAEQLPDGRLILDNRIVVQDWSVEPILDWT